jgi:glycosyltransferase involved in cell wall biosynthesis
MKVLWLCPHVPWPPTSGGKIRISKLSSKLASQGHEVHIWSLLTEPLPSGWSQPAFACLEPVVPRQRPRSRMLERLSVLFSRLPESAWAIRSGDMVQRANESSLAAFDVLLLAQSHMAGLLPELLRARRPIVLMTENVEYMARLQEAQITAFSRAKVRILLDSWRLRRLEYRAVQDVSAVTVVSTEDRDRLVSLNPGIAPTFLIPNGVDLSYFGWSNHARNQGDELLFTGHMGYGPNRNACAWMTETILPQIRRLKPTAQLRMVGMGGGPERASFHQPGQGAYFVGQVPDVRPYFARADVCLVPLRWGGGTRLKILEALASGVPVVTTSVGAEGLGAVEEGVVVVADSPTDFAEAVVTVLNDEPLRARLSVAGREFVARGFGWDVIANDLEKVLSALVASSSRR